jgi:hypothetical protein
MARKTTTGNSARKPAAPANRAKVRNTTEVRNTSVPRATAASTARSAAARPNVVTQEMIARRAYEISISGNGSSQDENWYRAERELRGA